MAGANPFGEQTRRRVLEEYFAHAAEVTPQNAWEHVYRCLLWMDQPTGLAHIYDANHMQPGGNFHGRAVRFTDALCEKWNISHKDLPAQIDHLFKGCVDAWRSAGGPRVDPEIESELVLEIQKIINEEGVPSGKAPALARRTEA